MSCAIEKATQAYDACPRCKSHKVEQTGMLYHESRYIFERLSCHNCGLVFEQVYGYHHTHGVWEENEEEA